MHRLLRPPQLRNRNQADAESAPGDEDVLAAVVAERLVLEAAEEILELEPCDVDQPEPFVLRRPPERARPAVVECEVDSIVADAVANRVWDGRIVVLPVQLSRDPVVERKRVPRKPPSGAQRRCDSLEGATAVCPRGEVEQRPERAVDQRCRLVERE